MRTTLVATSTSCSTISFQGNYELKTLHLLLPLALAVATMAVQSTSASELATESPAGASTYIVIPKDGDIVPPTFKVVFGLSGMGVAPAGVEIEHTGHHHVLVDQESLPEQGVPMGSPPMHFGKGQTETEITLEPGTHTLQLILGNHLHVPHNPPVVSEKITITVKE